VRLDINQASLAEFEKLPGIGFILAQRIIAHREDRGRLNQPEDLLEVEGFSQFILDGLADRLYAEAPPEPAPEEAPAPDTGPITWQDVDAGPELAAARQAIEQGEVSQALERYASLINAGQSLEEVTQDLEDASRHHPEEMGIWQHLGDAYLRANDVQKALEAYVRAEELLR
jgi:competence ComEA-like helix-hairpin-helix protein